MADGKCLRISVSGEFGAVEEAALVHAPARALALFVGGPGVTSPGQPQGWELLGYLRGHALLWGQWSAPRPPLAPVGKQFHHAPFLYSEWLPILFGSRNDKYVELTLEGAVAFISKACLQVDRSQLLHKDSCRPLPTPLTL